MVPQRATPFRRLIHHTKSLRPRIIAACVCSVLNKLFDLAPPLLIGAAVDMVVAREDSLIASFGIPDVLHQLYALAALTVVIWALESLFEYLFAWLWRNLAQEVQHELRLEAYGHTQSLPMDFFTERSRGDLLAVLNDDINQLERFLDNGANDLIQVATTALTVGAIFFVIAPEVAIWAMLPMPFVFWGSLRFQSRIAPRYGRVRAMAGRLNGLLVNNLAGIATIKAFTAESREITRVTTASADYRQANADAIRLSAAFVPLIRMVIVVGFTATLIYGGVLALEGELAVGAYSVLIFLTQRLLWPLTRLGSTLDLFQRAMASTDRILNLIDTPVARHDVGAEMPSAEIVGTVTFNNISFAYPDGPPVLQHVTLRVQPGQTLAIVGPSGSGKTSLIRLLLRLHDPQEGEIAVDGRITADIRLADLRKAIGTVGQHPFLFPGTIRDNIAYGNPNANEAAIVEASQMAEAHPFIEELPGGYDCQIGEDGQKLSGGQRQRLCIARAILKGAPILVLDEATSAVDNETEAALQRSLARLGRDRTVIVIAHRLSTIRHTDHIVVLDAGRIVEEGSHDTLVGKDGLYARLWRVQTGTPSPTEEGG